MKTVSYLGFEDVVPDWVSYITIDHDGVVKAWEYRPLKCSGGVWGGIDQQKPDGTIGVGKLHYCGRRFDIDGYMENSVRSGDSAIDASSLLIGEV